jgi:hypothetical protein
MLRMRKIALGVAALALFVASPAAATAATSGPGPSKAPKGPPPTKGLADGH